MLLHALDHFTVRAEDLETTARFYEALGMARGPRPPFPTPGQWLYAGPQALIHILQATARAPAGRIDHVALAAQDRSAIQTQLNVDGVPFRLHRLPDDSGIQLFLQDPNGVRLELVFCEKQDQ